MPTTLAPAELRADIDNFYARHMQLLDAGRVEEWADAFTPDGVFDAQGHPEPVRGREEIRSASRVVADKLAEAGIVRRHWLGMSHILPEDGSVRVRSYALVFQSSKEKGTVLHASTTCEDVLVPDGGSWLIRERVVRVDGMS
ncbi:nuclear transport factor 2 family protein [Actinomadura sp. WMMA1423]|uniref:nuclear transport factor 2 family protein n=1 Tax=Actinomadura sp. WMMA1423 TaxID=2591108 RepID=UPI0011463729|nr:nuclear transport factor 2 family protein [Actinomadura sp. WMMA1423]